MSADPNEFIRGEQEAAADEAVRALFGVEPTEDRSGLLGPAPDPPPGEADEDALFQAHMRRFPGSVG